VRFAVDVRPLLDSTDLRQKWERMLIIWLSLLKDRVAEDVDSDALSIDSRTMRQPTLRPSYFKSRLVQILEKGLRPLAPNPNEAGKKDRPESGTPAAVTDPELPADDYGSISSDSDDGDDVEVDSANEPREMGNLGTGQFTLEPLGEYEDDSQPPGDLGPGVQSQLGDLRVRFAEATPNRRPTWARLLPSRVRSPTSHV